MNGVFNHFNLNVGDRKQIGVASLSAFEFSRKKDPIYFMRAAMNGMAVYDGKYIRLHVNGELMMSDTDMEKQSNRLFVNKANGRVLVAGLGIGLIVNNVMPKIESGEITELIVIEKYKDVIDLISPYFQNDKIKIIAADIFKWKPEKGEKFDTIYFDIWPTICTDNLKEITFLHNSFKNKLNRSNPYCWMKERLQKENRSRSSRFY